MRLRGDREKQFLVLRLCGRAPPLIICQLVTGTELLIKCRESPPAGRAVRVVYSHAWNYFVYINDQFPQRDDCVV